MALETQKQLHRGIYGNKRRGGDEHCRWNSHTQFRVLGQMAHDIVQF